MYPTRASPRVGQETSAPTRPGTSSTRPAGAAPPKAACAMPCYTAARCTARTSTSTVLFFCISFSWRSRVSHCSRLALGLCGYSLFKRQNRRRSREGEDRTYTHDSKLSTGSGTPTGAANEKAARQRNCPQRHAARSRRPMAPWCIAHSHVLVSINCRAVSVEAAAARMNHRAWCRL